jgi:hypothetical protein
MGYVLTRRIQNAANWDRHTMASFLVVFATLIRSRLTSQRLWGQILDSDIIEHRTANPGTNLPDNAWQGLAQFSRHRSHHGPTHGITMSHPDTKDAPWVVRTAWKSVDFIMILRSCRVTAAAMLQLAAYSDLFIRSRAANGPLQGILFHHAQHGDLIAAPYISAPADPAAFIDQPTAQEDAPTAGTMDVDDESQPPPPTAP